MKIVTINLPLIYLDAIKVLTDLRKYPSRSEFVRQALGSFLRDDLKLAMDLENIEKIVKEGSKCR